MSVTQEATKQAKPRRLGRGLSGLIGELAPVVVGHQVSDNKHTVPGANGTVVEAPGAGADSGLRMLAVGEIEPSPFQPRRAVDEDGLRGLAASIRQSGLMQPVIVRPRGTRFELVAGERRWRAASLAGLERVPALVRGLSDEESAQWALVENLQREDLDAMERAGALRRLCERFGLSQADLADRVGLDRSTVANLIRLTELEPAIARLISMGSLTAGHGKALLAAPAGEARVRLAETAASQRWSVRRVEQSVRRLLTGPGAGEPGAAPAASADRAELERQLSDFLGTKVTIRSDRGGKRGRLMIEFYGLDHFDGLMARLGFRMQ